MNRGSAVGNNINYIMWKYEVPRTMCRGMSLLTSSSQPDVSLRLALSI